MLYLVAIYSWFSFIGLTVWLVKESVYNLKELKILQAICEDISLRAFDSTLILMITLNELIDCCLLSWSSSIVVHAQGRTFQLTLAHCLIHQSRCTVCLQKSNPTRFSAALSPLVRRCLNSSSRVPWVGSDLFTFLYDNFIYLNLMYGLTKLSLVKHNIRFIRKVTRWQVT